MGGLRKKMPLTFLAMLLSTLAISGIPLFAGFYSKDKIIQAAFMKFGLDTSGAAAYASVALPLAAALTAFYMFRLIFMTFFGKPRDQHIHDHAHESPKTMTIPLLTLAFLAVLAGKFWLTDPAGFMGGEGHEPWFERLVGLNLEANTWSLYPGIVMQSGFALAHSAEEITHASHSAHIWAMVVSLLVAGFGIFAAAWIYLWRKADPAKITGALGELYTTVLNKYYVDEFVNMTVIKGCMVLAAVQKTFDERVVDGTVLAVGRINVGIGYVAKWIDENIVDGTVRLTGAITDAFSSVVRLFQSGRIQQYATAAVGGALLLAAWMILS